MKQIGNRIRFGINTRQVRSLVQIAIDTGKREVVEIISPAVTLRNDVLNVKRGERRIILVQTTVFAGILRAPADFGSSPRPDHRWAASW